jgi:hypothetical protein
MMKEKIKKIFEPKLKLARGTRLVSFLFIGASILIAAGILIAVNMYYNIDTGEVVVEEIQRIANVLRATGGLIVGGTATQNPSAGYVFEVVGSSKLATTTIATGPLTLYAANQELRFTGGTSYYVGFRAPTTLSATSVYTWPPNYPAGSGYILTSDTSGNLSWTAPGTGGIGDITQVGDCASGDCFTGSSGSTLWFKSGSYTGALTVTALSANATYTLPAVSGAIALGSGTTTYVAYWTGTNTLGGEQYLSTTRGGTGANSSGWSGMIRVVGGSWGTVQGTAGYAAYWSDANTVAAEQYLAVSRGGTGAGSFTQYGILYGNGTGALGVTTAGNTYQILTANTGAAPTWRNIADLITATNGLTSAGTTQLTLKLGGTLTENTTINLNNYNFLFNLASGGTAEKFAVQVGGSDILVVNDQGQILYKNYPLAQTGKQVLREMIPIMGFDLPFRCGNACNTATTVSRTIEDYPFSAPETGATRVHKFVIRYADTGTTTPSTWIVYNETDATTTATFTVPATNSDLAKGKVYITGNVSIPGAGKKWHLRLQTPSGMTIQVYQIFLAAYDQLP